MTGLFVPVSIIIVGHDIDNIKVLVELRYIITVVDHLLSWRNSGSKQKPSGFEFSTQFSYKSSKIFFIGGWSFFTINLCTIEIFLLLQKNQHITSRNALLIYCLKLNYLPANWILPIKIKTLESVLFNEIQSAVNKLLPGCLGSDHSAVLITFRVIPTSKSYQCFDSFVL